MVYQPPDEVDIDSLPFNIEKIDAKVEYFKSNHVSYKGFKRVKYTDIEKPSWFAYDENFNSARIDTDTNLYKALERKYQDQYVT